MKKLQINIFDFDLNWIGVIDAIESFVHRTSWHEIPISELKVSRSAKGVEALKIGRILVVNNQKDKALIIEDMTTDLNDQYWNFNCISLKGLLNYRICHPWDAGSFAARKQSEVMMIIAFNNLVSQTRDNERKFMNSAGTVNMFGVTGLKVYGDTIDFTIDWSTGYMGDAIVTLSKMYGVTEKFPIGWNVFINDGFTQLVMDTYRGTDKTINQEILPPVVFSEEYGNIKNARYIYSIKEWRNAIYLAFNDGASDVATYANNPLHGSTVSFNRKEVIYHSSKNTFSEVENEGRSELNKRPHIESFTAEIINNENTMTTYNRDWFIGDIVTIQSKEILKDQIVSVNAQITEIEEIYDQGEYTINATFGEGKLSLIQLIKNSIAQKK